MMFLLVDDHGEIIGRYYDEGQARLELTTMAWLDGADDVGLVEINERGERIGGPWVWRKGEIVLEPR